MTHGPHIDHLKRKTSLLASTVVSTFTMMGPSSTGELIEIPFSLSPQYVTQ
jgi:hypothetical protein